MKFSTPFSLLTLTVLLTILSASSLKSYDFWERIPSPATNDVNILKIDENDNLYACIWGKGLFVSTNDGVDWTPKNNGLSNKYILTIEFDSTGNMLIGTHGGGAFISSNGGDNWSEINNGLTNNIVKAFTVNADGIIFAGTYGGGIYKSTDNGANWVQTNTSHRFFDITAMTIGKDGAIVSGTNGGGIFRSTNNGDTWRQSNAGLQSLTISSFIHSSGGDIFCSTFGGDVHLSVNEGASWQVFDSNSVYEDHVEGLAYHVTRNVTSMVWNANNELCVATSDIGIWVHTETEDAWNKTSALKNGVNCIAINSKGKIFAAYPLYGIVVSTNNGMNFGQPVSLNDYTDFTIIAPYEDDLILAATETPGDFATKLFKSTDNGLTWDQLTSGPGTSGKLINDIAYDSSGNTYAVTADDVWMSDNFGESWVSLGLSASETSCEAIAINQEGDIFVARNQAGESSMTATLFKSTNTGQDWQTLLSLTDEEGSEIGINYNGDVYYLTTTEVRKSTNNGSNFSTVTDTGFTTYNAVDFRSNNDVILATAYGVKYSTNGGTSWSSEDFEGSFTTISGLCVSPDDNIYAIRDWSGGVFYNENGKSKWDTLATGKIFAYQEAIADSRDGRIYLGTNVLYHAVDEPSMVVPELLDPPNNYAAADLNPVLTWHSAERAELYEIQVAYDNKFVNRLETIVLGDTTRKMNITLDFAKKYYWRVRSKTNASYSEWSQVWAFGTIIPYPELASPANEQNSTDTSLTFSWFPVQEASEYHFQLAKDVEFTDIVDDQEGITDTFHIVNGLDKYTAYYWRVKAKGIYSESYWSDIWSFRTKLETPKLREPADGSLNLPTEVTMLWQETTGAVSYEIQVATDEDFNDLVFEGQTDEIDKHMISLLEYYTTYYWRIRANDIEGNSDWSDTWKFTTVIKPALLVKPADSTFNMEFDIEFEWAEYDQAEYYHLQIATDPDFENIVYEEPELTEFVHEVTGLESCTEYFWRVRYINGENIGLWSGTGYFTTDMEAAALNYPENNATGVLTTTFLTWEEISCADSYEANVAKDADFTNDLIKLDNITETRVSLKNKIETRTEYFWRIRPKNEHGIGPWSETWEFKTDSVVSVFEPQDKEVSNVSPNPFSEKTRITFELKTDSEISAEILDNCGKLVEFLFRKNLKSGRQEFEWIPRNLTSGIYFIRISSAKDKIFEKVIYIK